MDTKHLNPLINALDDGYRHRPDEMLTYFLSSILSLWGLPQLESVPDTARPKIEGAIEAYSRLVATFEPFMDILGPVYMELSSRGARKQLAQFFTPWNLAAMMVRITASDMPKNDDGQLIKVCDPACGSGVMLLAFAQYALGNWGDDALLHLSLTGCDLDHFCARMMAVQVISNCNIHNIKLGEVVVLRGNSLCPDKDMEMIVHATAPSVPKPVPALAPQRLAALSNAARGHPNVVQGVLF